MVKTLVGTPDPEPNRPGATHGWYRVDSFSATVVVGSSTASTTGSLGWYSRSTDSGTNSATGLGGRS